jgi:hypothetical protein
MRQRAEDWLVARRLLPQLCLTAAMCERHQKQARVTRQDCLRSITEAAALLARTAPPVPFYVHSNDAVPWPGESSNMNGS